MAYQPPPKRYDPAGTPRNNSVELSGLIGDLRNLSIFAPGASGYQNSTNPVRPIQQAPVMNHYQPAFNPVNGPGNPLPLVSNNNENGHQPGFNRNFVNVPGNQHLIGGNFNTNGHQPSFDRNFINLQQGNQHLVSGNSNMKEQLPGFNHNFGTVPSNLLPIGPNNRQFEIGHQPGFDRDFVEEQGNQHLIGGNAKTNGHQLGFNPNFVTVQDNQLPIVSNKMQFENGHQRGFNSNFDNVPSIQHLIGGNPNTNGYGGGDHSYQGPKKAEATGEILNHTHERIPKDHRDPNQFSKVGNDSKNTFLFPHLPSSLLRESRTDDTVLIPYQMSAAKFLLCTAPHMFEIGIGNVIDMVDQWDNPVPQLTGTSQSGDSIVSKNSENGEM